MEWVLIAGHYINAEHIIRVGPKFTGMNTIYLIDGHEITVSEDELSCLISYMRIKISIMDPKAKRNA